MRSAILALALSLTTAVAAAQTVADMSPRSGWRMIDTDMPYSDLLGRLRAAIPDAGMALVTEAGPTEAAAGRGISIPGNRVVGVFNNDFAVRILAQSTPAMIEAPIRFYVTESGDGTATISWKIPSLVLAPYIEEAGPELAAIAAELDAKFEEIAKAATGG